MDFLHTFLIISLQHLNLFSFMLGMLYTLMSMTTWGNQKSLWFQLLLYVAAVAFYYYAKAELR
jgi:hypothetical protein